jgi:hypothetical protein
MIPCDVQVQEQRWREGSPYAILLINPSPLHVAAEDLYIISYPTFLTAKNRCCMESQSIDVPAFKAVSLQIALINIDLFLNVVYVKLKQRRLIIADVIYGKRVTLSGIVNRNSIHNLVIYSNSFQIYITIYPIDTRHRWMVRTVLFHILAEIFGYSSKSLVSLTVFLVAPFISTFTVIKAKESCTELCH